MAYGHRYYRLKRSEPIASEADQGIQELGVRFVRARIICEAGLGEVMH